MTSDQEGSEEDLTEEESFGGLIIRWWLKMKQKSILGGLNRQVVGGMAKGEGWIIMKKGRKAQDFLRTVNGQIWNTVLIIRAKCQKAKFWQERMDTKLFPFAAGFLKQKILTLCFCLSTQSWFLSVFMPLQVENPKQY